MAMESESEVTGYQVSFSALDDATFISAVYLAARTELEVGIPIYIAYFSLSPLPRSAFILETET